MVLNPPKILVSSSLKKKKEKKEREKGVTSWLYQVATKAQEESEGRGEGGRNCEKKYKSIITSTTSLTTSDDSASESIPAPVKLEREDVHVLMNLYTELLKCSQVIYQHRII